MATQSWTTNVDHTTDAGFRAWGSELSAKLLAAGLTQTADTGQINWVTVLRPGINTDGGYEIWRFNDTQQATAPVFLKIFYGTAGTATFPRIRLQVGTASNGTGTVSGTGSANTITITSAIAINTVTNYASYLCYAPGFLGLSWKVGMTGTTGEHYAMFCIARSVDNTGTANADATCVYVGSTNVNQVPLQYSNSYLTSVLYGGTGVLSYGVVHYGVTNSLVGGTAQVYKHYLITPRVRPNLYNLTTVLTEIGVGTQFTATTVGATSHNYIVCSRNAAGLGSTVGTHGFSMLWE